MLEAKGQAKKRSKGGLQRRTADRGADGGFVDRPTRRVVGGWELVKKKQAKREEREEEKKKGQLQTSGSHG